MGRKPKCTVEEKVAAVEDHLNGTRSVSEIMVDLSIKSTRTIRNWILAYQNGGYRSSLLLTVGFVQKQSEVFVRMLPVLMPALMKYRHMFYKNSPSSTSCTA